MLVAILMGVASVAFAASQTTCPVMVGNAINPKLYVDATVTASTFAVVVVSRR